MVSSPCDFVVHIFQSEIDEIRRYYEEQKQTRGDLFGLWTTSGNVVVHLASDASVQGEEQTLKSFLKKKYMLCRVGKWQYEPNEARNTKPREQEQTASETARRHCARGCYTSRVLLSFGSGNQNNDVQAYFHPEQEAKSCTATLRILGTEASGKTSRNPLRNVPAIQKKLEERKSVNEVKKGDPIGGQDQGSVSSSSQVNEHNGKPISAREVYEGQRDENTRPAGISIAQTQQPVSNLGDFIIVNSPTSSRSSSNSMGQQPAAPGFLSSDTGERILEEILREICSLVRDPQEIDVQRTPSTGHLQFKFKINETQIEVQFSKTFPEDPAKILVTSTKKPYQFDAKPKKNEEFNTSKNILIAIRSFSDLFNPQQSTAPAFVQAVGTFFSKVAQVVSGNHDDPKETTFLEFSNELCVKIADEFSIASVVNVQIKKDKPGERVELTFEHNKKQYVIAIPVEFPGKSARIYNLVCDKKYVAAPKDGQNINNFHKILNAVKHECSCVPCRRCRFEQE